MNEGEKEKNGKMKCQNKKLFRKVTKTKKQQKKKKNWQNKKHG